MNKQRMLKQLNDAIAAHGAWKARLRNAALRDDRALNPIEIAQDHICGFGSWLDELQASPEEFTGSAKTVFAIRRAHAEFHRAAGQVAQHIVEGRTDTALDDVNNGAFMVRSDELKQLIVNWRAQLMSAPE